MTSSGDSKIYKTANEEIDLIDMIGFAWQSRYFILCGCALAFCIALFIWYSTKVKANNTDQNQNYQVQISGEVANDTNPDLVARSLTKFSKTASGVEAFYQGLMKASNDPGLKNRIKMQDYIQSFDTRNDTFFVVLSAPSGWDVDQFKNTIPTALNSVIDAFNEKSEDLLRQRKTLAHQLTMTQLEFASIKYKSLLLFEKYSTLPSPSKQALLTGLGSEMATIDEDNSVLFMLNSLLGISKEAEGLIVDYEEILVKNSLIQEKIRIQKKHEVDEPTNILPKFGKVVSIQPFLSSTGAAISSINQNILVLLTLALFGGTALGLILSAMSNFWRLNQQRLRQLLSR
jgi:hypothetical protein